MSPSRTGSSTTSWRGLFVEGLFGLFNLLSFFLGLMSFISMSSDSLTCSVPYRAILLSLPNCTNRPGFKSGGLFNLDFSEPCLEPLLSGSMFGTRT